jgi:peptidoglycan/LPS O-acetylase OafA/YrhL
MPLGDVPSAGTGGQHRPRSLGYQPALDGLRGIALIAIVVYHSGLSWAPGAFLSVSTFFTLSGFLITALLLAEHHRTRTISLRAFWGRRFRRLLPAATVAIILIIVATALIGDGTQLARLRGDALSSIAYVANWHFIASGDTYGAAFQSPSPFTHFWTLAIEEQFYVVFPALVAVVLTLGRGSRRTLTVALVALGASSLAWSAYLLHRGASLDRLYFGTDVRLVEFVTGALLAVAWSRRGAPATGRRARIAANGLGVTALALMLLLWATANVRDPAVYRGGLAAYSVLTALVIVAALQPSGPVRFLLARPALVWVGVVSYAAYLVHYPILLALESHTRLAPLGRFAIALPLTLLIAAGSARWLERPIRRGVRFTGPRSWIAVPAAVTLAVVVTLVATTAAPGTGSADLADVPRRFESALRELAPKAAVSTAPRVAVYGDSSALMTGLGLLERSVDRPDETIAVRGGADLGCAVLTDVTRKVRGMPTEVPAECRQWLSGWARVARAHPAVVQLGPNDVVDQQIGGRGPFVDIRDPEVTGRVREELTRGVDRLLDVHNTVVLLASPDIDVGRVDGRSPTVAVPESEPGRMERFREILRQIAATDDRIVVVDLAAWIDGRADDAELRPDGVHFTPASARTVAAWLAPRLVGIQERRTGDTTTLVP